MKIGEKIKQIRKEKKISQEELADTLGIRQPNVVYFEKRGDSLTIQQCINIASALNVSLKELIFGGTDYLDEANKEKYDYLLAIKDNEIDYYRKENKRLKEENNLLFDEKEKLEFELIVYKFDEQIQDLKESIDVFNSLDENDVRNTKSLRKLLSNSIDDVEKYAIEYNRTYILDKIGKEIEIFRNHQKNIDPQKNKAQKKPTAKQ